MGSTRLSFAFAAIYMIAGSACFDPTSATDLDPAGPPKIEQVRLYEDWTDSTGAAQAPRRVFAFGTHPQSEEPSNDDEHAVTTADPKAIGPIRIIMSELLLGNYLEQIECRGVVGTDVFDNVPVNATPDDIAKCSEADDVLPADLHRPERGLHLPQRGRLQRHRDGPAGRRARRQPGRRGRYRAVHSGRGRHHLHRCRPRRRRADR